MNYLELIVGFHRWKEVNPLPASAIALWHELVATCNKAGWPEEFTIPNGVLQANAGLSRKEFDRARQILIENELIYYKKSNRVNSAGKYKIIPRLFERDNERGNRRDNERGNRRDNERGHERGTLNKDLNINENNTPATSSARGEIDPFRMFESEGFGTISPVIGDRITVMIDDFGERWVCEAMRAAVVAGKRSLSYVEGILKRYKAEGVDEPWKVERPTPTTTRNSRSGRRDSQKPRLPVKKVKSRPLTGEERKELDDLVKYLESGGGRSGEPETV